MAILNMKASLLEYEEVTEGCYDDNGDYVNGISEWVMLCRCDVVPAGKANQIALPDGQLETYTYTVYNLPRHCRDFKYGDNVRLTILGQRLGVFKVKGFHRYQLQCKMWL